MQTYMYHVIGIVIAHITLLQNSASNSSYCNIIIDVKSKEFLLRSITDTAKSRDNCKLSVRLATGIRKYLDMASYGVRDSML